MEMVLKAIGVHRSTRELQVAWEAMDFSNDGVIADEFDAIRVPFEYLYDLLHHLGIDLGDLGLMQASDSARLTSHDIAFSVD